MFDYDNSNKNSSALSNKSLSKLDNKKNNKFNKEELDEDLQLAYDMGFDKDVIKSLTFQLITGSIVLPKESKLDVDKWMKTMESIFDKRFGNTDEGFDDFKEWANGYIEFVIMQKIKIWKILVFLKMKLLLYVQIVLWIHL